MSLIISKFENRCDVGYFTIRQLFPLLRMCVYLLARLHISAKDLSFCPGIHVHM